MEEETKQAGIWAALLAAVLVPLVLIGGTCATRGCEADGRTAREKQGQSAALRLECIQTGHPVAECERL